VHRRRLLHRRELRAVERSQLRGPRAAGRHLIRLLLAVTTIACITDASGCVREGCARDADCDATGEGYQRCDVAAGICLCTDDRGCGDGELCNALGRCQIIAGCADNTDCGASQFCNVTSGNCVPTDVCGSDATCCTQDAHCPFGSVCNDVNQQCEAGCHDDGDCRLGVACVGASLGQIGFCDASCTSDAQCAFGELCNLATRECQHDDRGPYCLGCTGGVQSDDCGDFGNFCLLDTINGGAYCGVDCSNGEACPFGYECRDVIILPRTTPTCALPEACVDGACARTGASCTVDEDCPQGPPGSDCPEADVGNCDTDVTQSCASDADCSGVCNKQTCRVREGAIQGVCSCTRDSQCPTDVCEGGDIATATQGHCGLSGRACFVDADCDTISCFQGGCWLGRNCKPANDRTCADLLITPLE
jgi:hypothetical protein